jgi:hypothetical protein
MEIGTTGILLYGPRAVYIKLQAIGEPIKPANIIQDKGYFVDNLMTQDNFNIKKDLVNFTTGV